MKAYIGKQQPRAGLVQNAVFHQREPGPPILFQLLDILISKLFSQALRKTISRRTSALIAPPRMTAH